LKSVKVIILLLIIASIITGSSMFVSSLIDEEMRRLFIKRIKYLDDQFDRGNRLIVSWRGGYHETNTILLNNPRAEQVFLELIETGEPAERVWCALIAAENSRLELGITTLLNVMRGAYPDRASALAYHYARDFAEIQTPRAAMQETLPPPSNEEMAEVETSIKKILPRLFP